MTVRWRESRIEDLGAVSLQLAQREMQLTLEDTPKNRDLVTQYARTWEDDSGKVLAVVGIFPRWHGVAEAWAHLSEESLKHPITLWRAVKGFLAEGIERYSLWRVQAVVDSGHEAGHRFIQRLGFQYEGVMRGYGPTRRDHALYALVKES